MARCKKPHMYRVFWFESNAGGGDRREEMHIRACNIDDAEQYILKNMFKPEFQKEVSIDGDDKFSILSTYEPNPDADPDDFIDEGTEEGYQIEEDDEEEADFKTIYGTNDFVDLSKGHPRKAKDWNENLARISRSGDMKKLGEELTKDAQEYAREVRRQRGQ